MRLNVYIDGYNFYYGAVKKTDLKWLDFAKLCSLLFLDFEVHRIRYFSAVIIPPPDDLKKARRQLLYWRALRTLPNLSIHRGSFKPQEVVGRLLHPSDFGGQDRAPIKLFREKGSDVNLAAYLLRDVALRECDAVAVFSNDSDLKEAMRIAREDFGATVIFVNTERKKPCRDLSMTASEYREIRTGLLRVSQFPPVLYDEKGPITRPAEW